MNSASVATRREETWLERDIEAKGEMDEHGDQPQWPEENQGTRKTPGIDWSGV